MKNLSTILFFFITTLLSAQDNAKQHDLLEEVKGIYLSDRPNQCDTFKGHFDDNEAKDEITFLNKDFSTTLFSNACSVGYWSCSALDETKNRMHIGFISLLFTSAKEKDAALKKINAAKRTNFKVEKLTIFKLKSSEKELLFIYTETMRNKSTSIFWEKI